MTFSIPIDVRFRDIDSLDPGNHGVFVDCLEHARFHWWRAFIGDRPFEEEAFQIARLEIDYRKPLLAKERVRVDMRCDRVGTSSFTLAYKVIREPDGVVLAEAQTVQVFMDVKTQRPKPIRSETLAWLRSQA